MTTSPESVKPGDLAVVVALGLNCDPYAGSVSKRGGYSRNRWLGRSVDVVAWSPYCSCCVEIHSQWHDAAFTALITPRTNLLKISPDPETEDMETREPVTDHA